MAETADELGLVERVGSHLHTTHEDHVLVHADEHVLGDLDLKPWGIGLVAMEGVLVQLNGERLSVRGLVLKLCRVRRRL